MSFRALVPNQTRFTDENLRSWSATVRLLSGELAFGAATTPGGAAASGSGGGVRTTTVVLARAGGAVGVGRGGATKITARGAAGGGSAALSAGGGGVAAFVVSGSGGAAAAAAGGGDVGQLVTIPVIRDGGAAAGGRGGGVATVAGTISAHGGAAAIARPGGVLSIHASVHFTGGGFATGRPGGSIAKPPTQPWFPREETDDYYAILPPTTGQRVLRSNVATIVPAVRGTCGWHGTRFDPIRGAVAIARTGGPFADLVGERVLLTYFKDPTIPRSVVVYITDEAYPDQDLTIPRVMFVRLASLAQDQVTVVAEVLA